MHTPAEEQGRARVPEIVEPYLREPGFLEQRLEGTFHEVLGLDRRPDARSENQVLVLVETGQAYSLL